MLQIHRFSNMTALALAFLVGCGPDDEGRGGQGDPDAAVEPQAKAHFNVDPPAGSNGLLPSCFWAHGAQGALRSLGAGPLDQGNGALPPISTGQIPLGCREVLEYTVACALPQGQSVSDPVTSAKYGGHWGLAPGWRTAALGTDGRRYVTACLVGLLNATGTPFPLVLEGPAAPIQRDEELSEIYSLEEATILGDLFSSQTPLGGLLPAFNVYSCWEDLLPQSCGVLGLPLLGQRVCDDLLLCGYVSLGPCSLACAPNGPYRKCKPGLLSPYWTQTVRIRLDPATCQ